MAEAASDGRMSVEQFHRWHERQEGKYELVGGVPVLKRGMGPRGMVGGTARHSRISLNAAFELHGRLRGKPCDAHGSDFPVRTGPDQLRYPDASVDCGPDDPTRREAHTPTLVVEVLSPSTSLLDQTQKLDEYKAVETLQHILIVDQRRADATLLSRTTDGWQSQRFGDLADVIAMDALGIEMPMAELYRDVTFDDPDA